MAKPSITWIRVRVPDQPTGLEVDPTDPLARKFMDDVAGAINRREVAEGPFNVEEGAYRAYMNSVRGKVARCFVKNQAGGS